MTEPEPDRRRIPGGGAGVALLALVGAVTGVVWWLNHPRAEAPASGQSLAELDVVCLGRVDGLKPVAHLEPALPGKVAKVYDVAGKRVEAGTPILELDSETLQLRVEEAAAAVAAADVEIEAAKQEQKLHPLRKATQGAAIAAAADRTATARRILEEKRTARTFGTVTAVDIIAAEADVKQCEQLEGVEKSRLKEVEASPPGLKLRAAEAKKALADIALKQARKAVRDCAIVAPAAGTVLRVTASVGEAVAPGSPAPPVMFRPDGNLVVRAELEQEFLGRVKPGMRAAIRDDARADSPVWHGSVVEVGRVVARKRLVLLDPGEMNDVRTVECVVSLEGNTDGLLVGQRMRVRIGRGE